MSSDYLSFVKNYLIVEGTPCYRHCEKPVHFKPFSESESNILGAYVCQDNYVSRIVYFAMKPDSDWVQNFLQQDLDGGQRVRVKDIRVATRHGWELGKNAELEAKKIFKESEGIKEYYWTFYPANDYEKSNGNFLCESCGKLFVQANSSKSNVCTRHAR